MEDSNNSNLIRFNPTFQELEIFINSELKNKYLLKERIEEYRSNLNGIPYVLIENQDQIKIQVKERDIEEIYKLKREDLQNKHFLIDKDNKKKIRIVDIKVKRNYYIFTIELSFEAEEFPDQGTLYYYRFSGDDYQNSVLIRSLNDLKSLNDKNCRNLIENLIIESDQNSAINISNNPLLKERNFSKEQRDVLIKYFEGKKLLIIMGDAGTGKSTVLHHIIKNEINNKKRVLCIAQANKIVDEYLNNLIALKLGNRLFLRLAKDIERIQEDLKKYSVESKFEGSYHKTLEELSKNINNRSESRRIIEIQKKWKNYLEDNPRIFRRLTIYSSEAIFSTTMGLFSYLHLFSKQIPFDTIIFDEASLITFSEFLSFGQFGKKWIVAGDDNQLHQFRNPEILRLIREDIFDLKPEDRYLFSRNLLKYNNIGFYASILRKHLRSIKEENFIGWNILKVIDNKDIFNHLKNNNQIIELIENFRLPPIINDVFKKSSNLEVNIDRFENITVKNASSLEDRLRHIIEFKNTDRFGAEAVHSNRGHQNRKEVELTLNELRVILQNLRNTKDEITIGIGSAWNDQINLISKALNNDPLNFQQTDPKGRRFHYTNNENVIILVDTFWSLASKNIDILIWNFVKCEYRIIRNSFRIRGDIFTDLYAADPNLFNCFLKRFKQKLIIIGCFKSFRRYLCEITEYIELIQENGFSSKELNRKIDDFKKIRNFLAMIKNIIDIYPK